MFPVVLIYVVTIYYGFVDVMETICKATLVMKLVVFSRHGVDLMQKNMAPGLLDHWQSHTYPIADLHACLVFNAQEGRRLCSLLRVLSAGCRKEKDREEKG